MKFYKRKIFYVSLAVLLLLSITCALVYKPMKLIYSAAIDFPMNKKRLDKMLYSVEGDKESLDKFLKHYQPNLQEFGTLLDYSKTAKRDFMVAHYLGLGDDYFVAYVNSMFMGIYQISFASFVSLGLKYNLPNINESHISFLSFVESQNLSYLQNTQELIDYLTENNCFGDESCRMIHVGQVILVYDFLKSLHKADRLCSFQKKDRFFQQMQENYKITQGIQDKKLIQVINLKFGSLDKMLSMEKNYIAEVKGLLNECK